MNSVFNERIIPVTSVTTTETTTTTTKNSKLSIAEMTEIMAHVETCEKQEIIALKLRIKKLEEDIKALTKKDEDP